MASNRYSGTQVDKLCQYLRSSGRSITPTQAFNKFGVRNLKAAMNRVRDRVEAYGNHVVIEETSVRGTPRYYIEQV